jgi:hypothetical protein
MTTAGYILIGVVTIATITTLTLWFSAVRKGKDKDDEKEDRENH